MKNTVMPDPVGNDRFDRGSGVGESLILRRERNKLPGVRFWWIACLALALPGCTLETQYATPRGASINGVTGLVDLIKSTGRRTDVWAALSPKMAKHYGAIVVFVSDYDQVSKETIDHVSQLLWDESIETILIVVRDSDCAIDYWTQVTEMPNLKPADVEAARRARDNAAARLADRTSEHFKAKKGRWYGLEKVSRGTEPPTRSVEMSTEDPPITVTARWPLNRQLVPAEDMEVLWQSQDEPLLTSDETGRILVLASATPLLNGGLVDPGNRQLAERLVDRLPENQHVAVVISSNWSDGESVDSPSLWRFLKVHPHGWIFGQTFLAMIIFCWWKLPIFGRPRNAVSTESVRFGRHVEALGSLLQRTRDASFARQAIRDWHRGEKSRRGLNREEHATPETQSLEGK